MKKLYIALLLALFGVMAVVGPASAATLQFAPTAFNVNAGESFSVVVSLDPVGTKNYVTKLEASFPANILSVSSFTFGGGWTAIITPEYNITDNTNGLLVRGAGVAGGTLNPVTFGTITFTAKNGGSGVIVMNNANSLSLGGAGQNLLVGTTQASVNVTAVAGATTVVPSGTPNSPTGTGASQTQPGTEGQITPEAATTGPAEDGTTPVVTQTPTTDTTANPAQANLLAGVMNILSFGTGKAWLSWLVLLLIVIAIGYAINRYLKKKDSEVKTS